MPPIGGVAEVSTACFTAKEISVPTLACWRDQRGRLLPHKSLLPYLDGSLTVAIGAAVVRLSDPGELLFLDGKAPSKICVLYSCSSCENLVQLSNLTSV